MIEILSESIERSTSEFSSPNEIKRFLEDVTGENITTNRLSALLKELGFIHSRAYQRVGKNGVKSSFYHLKEDKKLRLHLKDSVLMDGLTPVRLRHKDTLGEINYKFLSARANKESSLASLRKIEAEISELRKDKLALENDIQSGEYISGDIAQRELDLALLAFKTELENFSLSLSAQLASINSEDEIYKILEDRTNRVLTKLSQLDIAPQS